MAADVLARMRAPEPIRLQHGLGTAPTNQQGRDTEDPGGDAASGVALCPPQPLTLQPAPGGRTALGTSLRPLTTLADKGSSPLGVGTGQPGSGVTENSAPAWSDSQLFLAGDGTGVTAKTPWEKGCHWGNYLPSS